MRGDALTALERRLPRYDFVERHAVTVAALPADAYAALRRADLRRSVVTRGLLLLRSLPGLVVAPRATVRRFVARGGPLPLTLDALASAGFVVLDEEPGVELVLGTIGRFWRPSGGMRRFAPHEFASFEEAGWAKAAWNFRVEPGPNGGAIVSTETRVLCTDAPSRRAFRRYWWIVRPFSGLIRLDLLRIVRREAERRG